MSGVFLIRRDSSSFAPHHLDAIFASPFKSRAHQDSDVAFAVTPGCETHLGEETVETRKLQLASSP